MPSLPYLLALAVLIAMPTFPATYVPTFDGSLYCDVAVETALTKDRTMTDCLADERHAQEELTRLWSEFRDADRRFCTRETQIAGPPSYIDLLVCLQITKGNADDLVARSKTTASGKAGFATRLARPGVSSAIGEPENRELPNLTIEQCECPTPEPVGEVGGVGPPVGAPNQALRRHSAGYRS